MVQAARWRKLLPCVVCEGGGTWVSCLWSCPCFGIGQNLCATRQCCVHGPLNNVSSSSLHRVDHLYTFFVQWSPEIYGKDAKEQGFVVVEKEELDMIDNFFSEPTTKSWEVSAFCFLHEACAYQVCILC